VERAIESFLASTNHAVDSFADLLLHDFHARCVSPDAIERLSKWANSGGTFASAVDPARRVAGVLLACPLPRLIDEHGSRVPDYDAVVAALGRQIGGGDPTPPTQSSE
jgi:hypothetical protein